MLLKLLAFEFKFHFKQWAFRISALGFLLLGIAMGASPAPFGQGVFANSPFGVIHYLGLLSLGTVIVVTLLAGGAILRDEEYRFAPLIFTTNLKKNHYLISRFLGMVGVGLVAFAFAVVGLFLGSQLPMVDRATLGPIQPLAYLWGYLVLGFPNLLFGAAIVFAVGAFSRNSMATFISAIFLYVLYFVGTLLGNSPLMASSAGSDQGMGFAALLDPYGLAGFMNQTATWSDALKNTSLPALSGSFLLNRLLILGIALSLFGITLKRYSFRVPARKKAKRETLVSEPAPTFTLRRIAPAKMGFSRICQGVVSQTWLNVRTLIKGLPYVALLAMWVFLMVTNLATQLIRGDFDTPFHPLTGILIPGIVLPMSILGALAVVFYSAELAWAERNTRFAAILDATPAVNAVFWAGKIGALAMLLGGLVVVSILASIGLQLFHGYSHFEWGLYGSLFAIIWLPLVLFGVLTLLIQTLIGNKYAGMAVGFVLMILCFTPLLKVVGLQHPLLRFPSTPEYLYSPMAGASYHGDTLGWFLLYSTALAGLLGFATLRFWKRGMRTSPLGSKAKAFAGVNLLLVLAAGGFLFYKLHLANPFVTANTRLNWQDQYERQYQKHADQPAPTLSQVRVAIDLFPNHRRAELNGTMILENRGDGPIDMLLIGAPFEGRDVQLNLAGATLDEEDLTLGQSIFSFSQPIQVGDRQELKFSLTVQKTGYQELNPDVYLLKEASYLEITQLLPTLGYNSNLEIRRSRERKNRGLPDREPNPTLAAPTPLLVEAVISTQKGQTVVAPGTQLKMWESEGRSFFEYRLENARSDWFAIASAPYKKETVALGKNSAEIYYHPKHDFNIETMAAAAKESYQYFLENYGDYPDKNFVLAEVPTFSKKFRVTSYPRTIFGVEDGVFLFQNNRRTLDLPFQFVAHKFGHLWWSEDPASMEGENLLTELLSTYTELVVNEKKYGVEGTLAYVRQFERRYFRFRSVMSWVEMPIIKTQDQPYISAYKSPHVVYALREELGESELNRLLSRILSTDLRNLSADQIIQDLISSTPLEKRERIRELLGQVVTYNMALESVEVMGNQLAVQIHARRTLVDEQGERFPGPVKDWVEMGFYQGKTLLRLENIFLDEEQQTFRFEVEPAVDAVVLNPRHLRLEADFSDNRRSLSTSRGNGSQ